MEGFVYSLHSAHSGWGSLWHICRAELFLLLLFSIASDSSSAQRPKLWGYHADLSSHDRSASPSGLPPSAPPSSPVQS